MKTVISTAYNDKIDTIEINDLEETQKAVLNEVNKIRSGKNLTPYKLHKKLNKAAQDHSEEMAQKNFLDHYSADKSTWDQRCLRAGYSGADLNNIGEDVAAGQTDAAQLLRDFCQSQGHYKPLVNTQYKHIGVGYAVADQPGYKYFWTIDFGYSAPDDDVEPAVPIIPEPDRNDFNFI